MTIVATDSAGSNASLLNRNVVWTSTNLTVASVNAIGVLQALAHGATSVTAIVDGVQSPAVPVTVTQAPVISVQVVPNTANVKVGLSVPLSAILRDVDNNILNGRVITWSTSDATLATVTANGLVQGVAQGTVTIKATSEGVEGVAIITVVP
jgi:uncharacterized protein YjdB